MELIDQLFFPGVVIAGMLLWAFAAYDKKLTQERIYARHPESNADKTPRLSKAHEMSGRLHRK